MYDLVPPSMKAQFKLINLPNQSIKLSASLFDKGSNKKNLSSYTYDKIVLFKYSINLKNSQINLDIYNESSKKNHFTKMVLGSFLYQTAIKYSVSEINIDTKNKSALDYLVFGFLQKDFIYSVYKLSLIHI